jgi:hypothetical protein
MNACAKRLVGIFGICLVGLRPAVLQGQGKYTSDPRLARVLAEVARDIRTGDSVYLVATIQFPQYVVGTSRTGVEARRLVTRLTLADSTHRYDFFGPYFTRRDSIVPEYVIDSVVVWTHQQDSIYRVTVHPDTVDALFLTPAAIEKFAMPFYAQLYGPAIAEKLLQFTLHTSPTMAGGCHKYSRLCWPRPEFRPPVIPELPSGVPDVPFPLPF